MTRSMQLRLDLEEVASRRYACVVHEHVDGGMALEHARGHGLDLLAIGHVAELPLAADLAGDRLQPVLATCEQDAVPAATRELARRCLSDPRRGSRDDGYGPLLIDA